MSLLNSKLNSIAAIAIDAEVNKASVDYVNANYYNKTISLAPSSNPIFTGDVTAPSFNATSSIKINGGAVVTAPQVSDTLTNYLLSANAASTYAPKADPIFTGTLTVTNITLNGSDLQTTITSIRPWVLARVNAGAANITFQNGQKLTASAVRNNVGNYTMVWPDTGVATSYVQLTCAAPLNNPRFVNYLNLTTTGCNVYITDKTGASVDSDFNIRVDVAG